jgi:predicted XRE-type DNA-binding protein
MSTKNKLNELDSSNDEKTPTVVVKKNELTKTINDLKGQNVNILPVNEIDGVIEPQDKATIKYLSNVKHHETGEIAQPFNIENKKYQMVRGVKPDKSIVLGVYCFDELNEDGSNKIYHVDEFESKVAKPMLEMEKLKTESENKPTQPESLNLGDYKHFVVNEKTGKFKKFKTIPELAATTMLEDERYMGLQEFKKFFESRVFGVPKRKELAEVGMTGQENDEEMTIKAQKLMGLIQKRIPSNIIDTIKTNKIAQREVIAAFAELIGVPRTGLSGLVQGIKNLAKSGTQPQQQVAENRVVKTIKKKDIK